MTAVAHVVASNRQWAAEVVLMLEKLQEYQQDKLIRYVQGARDVVLKMQPEPQDSLLMCVILAPLILYAYVQAEEQAVLVVVLQLSAVTTIAHQ